MADSMRALSDEQVQSFMADGFVRLDNAVPRELVEAARAILWPGTGCDPQDPATWTRPVVWLGYYGQAPFAQAVNMPLLHAAYDTLAGEGHWRPRYDLGTFPVRFPSREEPNDAGWHIDASFPPETGAESYFDWRVNLWSKGRALLMLFLFSDVGPDDAPTRIRAGSHHDVARLLEPAGEAGLSAMEISQRLDITAERRQVLATGEAGTVYLCHPFLAHAAQPHRGAVPRFLAQPPLPAGKPFQIDRPDGHYSPVESAIRLGLGLA